MTSYLAVDAHSWLDIGQIVLWWGGIYSRPMRTFMRIMQDTVLEMYRRHFCLGILQYDIIEKQFGSIASQASFAF